MTEDLRRSLTLGEWVDKWVAKRKHILEAFAKKDDELLEKLLTIEKQKAVEHFDEYLGFTQFRNENLLNATIDLLPYRLFEEQENILNRN